MQRAACAWSGGIGGGGSRRGRRGADGDMKCGPAGFCACIAALALVMLPSNVAGIHRKSCWLEELLLNGVRRATLPQH